MGSKWKQYWGVPQVSRKQMGSTAGWQQLVQSKWTWWLTRANFLNFVAITVAFRWEATALVVVTHGPGRGRQDGKENWQWCCWSREINDVKKWEPLSADRSVMILSVLWLWVFLQQTLAFFWDDFTAQRELLNHPVHPALAVTVTVQLWIDSSQPKSERQKDVSSYKPEILNILV